MGYKMKGYSYPGESPVKQKLKYTKPEKESTGKHHYKKNIKKDQHNIDAEMLNTTGETCIICGAPREGHAATKSHAFKSPDTPGPDTKPKA